MKKEIVLKDRQRGRREKKGGREKERDSVKDRKRNILLKRDRKRT